MPHIDVKHLPRHIAIIMDGNGRWAEQHGVSLADGHEAGAGSVRTVVEACRELERIEVLTLYAFSTENWRRSKQEIEALFRLLSKYIDLELENIVKEGIRVTIMGRKQGLDDAVVRDLERTTARTHGNSAMVLNLAVNYGARAEIVDAAKAVAAEVQKGRIAVADIDETLFSRHLYQPALPDPDLLIRTSGEIRLSNFMLWQLSYTEIVAMNVLWPDFGKRHLYDAIATFQARQRRFGGR